ncbi:hypothetical protein BDZ89DRAFT_1058912 [Hymenopellis radicata]|nr:hypothetical protein BDZ89DRAFT_1058912 [Hymenopellis radicata]
MSSRLDDAQFFAALSRRYADAAEEAACLRTQISALEQERDGYRDLCNERAGQPSTSTTSQEPAGQDLQTLGAAALERAREEYGRLKEEVKVAQDTVVSLQTENDVLGKDLAASRAECRVLSVNLDEARQARVALEERCAALEAEVKSVLEHANKTARDTRDAEIDALQEALAREKAANTELRRKTLDKSMLSTVTSSLQAASTSLHRRTESQPNLGLRRLSSRLSDTSHKTLPPPAEQPARPPAVASSPSYVTPIPDERLKELDRLPRFEWKRSSSHIDATFNRKFLADQIGGNSQSLIAKVKNQKNLAFFAGIDKYLCPNLDQNPWCPAVPGQHGYMFVGLGAECDTFLAPERCTLFIGQKRDSRAAGRFQYLGEYIAQRVDALTLDEWNTLSPEMKEPYCETTFNKSKGLGSAKEIRAKYDSGQLRVPCVRLQCVGFEDYVQETLAKTCRKSRPSIVSSPPKKRQRDVHDEGGRHRKMPSLP